MQNTNKECCDLCWDALPPSGGYFGGGHCEKKDCPCHLPPKPTEKDMRPEAILDRAIESGIKNGKVPTPTPEKEKCWHIKALNESGIKIPEGYICRACTPSTPAVEDWEKDFDKEFGEHHCVYNGDYKSFIRSLLKSDRKRIVEGLEKMRKDRTFTNFLRHDIADRCLGYYNQAISDAIKFITNLK